MWNRFRVLQRHRFPLIVVILACILVPPIVWRVLTATQSSSPQPVPSDSRAIRLYLSVLDKFYGKVIQVENGSSASGDSNRAPSPVIDDDQRSLAEVTRLALMRTSRESFQFVFDPNRRKVYFYSVGSTYVRFSIPLYSGVCRLSADVAHTRFGSATKMALDLL